MTRALSPKTLREIREFVDHAGDGDIDSVIRDAPRLLAAIDAALKPKKFLAPARKRKAAKLRSKKSETRDIRAAVFERSGGRCECCGRVVHGADRALQMDHFHGGSNRRALESVEGCWMLSWGCHALKSDCSPSRAHWLRLFLEHSERHGYDAEPQRKAMNDLASLGLQGRA